MVAGYLSQGVEGAPAHALEAEEVVFGDRRTLVALQISKAAHYHPLASWEDVEEEAGQDWIH